MIRGNITLILQAIGSEKGSIGGPKQSSSDCLFWIVSTSRFRIPDETLSRFSPGACGRQSFPSEAWQSIAGHHHALSTLGSGHSGRALAVSLVTLGHIYILCPNQCRMEVNSSPHRLLSPQHHLSTFHEEQQLHCPKAPWRRHHKQIPSKGMTRQFS